MWGRPPSAVQQGEAPQPTMPTSTTLTRTKTKAPTGGVAAARRPAQDNSLRQTLQLHREYRRVLRLARQKVYCPQNSSRRAHRQARIPPRPTRPPSKIWRGNCLPARRRRRRSQDYCTISSLRPEEAGGEVCPAGAGLACRGTGEQETAFRRSNQHTSETNLR